MIHKLIDGGLIETVKLVSDLYCEDFDMIEQNFEIMKKISSIKVGRETIIKKNLIPNIIKNTELAAALKNTKGTLIGLNIIDNITRAEGGKEALKKADIVHHLSNILDNFDNNEQILKMGAKIYSKIAKPEDLLKELDKLKQFIQSDDYSDLNELKKALVLVSNFILVDEIAKTLCQPENIKVIKDLFNTTSALSLDGRSDEYLKTYVLLNKYFMQVFSRIHNNIPEFFKEKEVEDNINNSVMKNFKAISKIRDKLERENPQELSSFINAFSAFFGSFADFFEKNYADKDPNEDVLLTILDVFLKDKLFMNDEKANKSACKIIKVANRIKHKYPKVKAKILELFDFLCSTVKFSDDCDTLEYALDILNDIYTEGLNKNNIPALTSQNGVVKYDNLFKNKKEGVTNDQIIGNCKKYFDMRDTLLKIIIDFMKRKPKYRKPVNKIN